MSPQSVPTETFDPTALAVALTKLQGDQAVLQRDVQVSIQNLTSSTHAVQAEVRHMGEQLAELARLQQQQVSHSEGLDRAFKAIEKLTGRMDVWIEKHEGENRTTADCVTAFRGGLAATRWVVGVVGTLVAGLLAAWIGAIAWNFNTEVANARTERTRIEAQITSQHAADAARQQAQLDALSAKLDQLESTKGAR